MKFSEVKVGEFFEDLDGFTCVKSKEVVDNSDDEWDEGFNALETNNGCYYRRSFEADEEIKKTLTDEEIIERLA